jgi:hypothetical protein
MGSGSASCTGGRRRWWDLPVSLVARNILPVGSGIDRQSLETATPPSADDGPDPLFLPPNALGRVAEILEPIMLNRAIRIGPRSVLQPVLVEGPP